MSFISQNTSKRFPIKYTYNSPRLSDSIAATMDLIGIKGVSSITNEGKMCFFSANDFFTYEYPAYDDSMYLTDHLMLMAFAKVTHRSIQFLLKELYEMNNNINPSFFCIEEFIESLHPFYRELVPRAGDLLPITEEKYQTKKQRYENLKKSYMEIKNDPTIEEFDKQIEAIKYKEEAEDYALHIDLFSVELEMIRNMDPDSVVENYMFSFRDESKITGPCIINGTNTWITTLPPVINEWEMTKDEKIVNVLADIIRKEFIGIGGFIDFEQGDEKTRSIVFMVTDHYNNREYDWRHSVSHEIDHEKLKRFYYHPLTVGEYLMEIFGDIEPTILYSSYDQYNDACNFLPSHIVSEIKLRDEYLEEGDIEKCREIEKDLKILLDDQFNRQDPYPLYNTSTGRIARSKYDLDKILKSKEVLASYSTEEKQDFISEMRLAGECTDLRLARALMTNNGELDFDERILETCLDDLKKYQTQTIDFRLDEQSSGFQILYGVPIDLQIRACAKVANLSEDNMLKKIIDATNKKFVTR